MFPIRITIFEGKTNYTKTDLKEVIQYICFWMLKKKVLITAINWPNNYTPEMILLRETTESH